MLSTHFHHFLTDKQTTACTYHHFTTKSAKAITMYHSLISQSPKTEKYMCCVLFLYILNILILQSYVKKHITIATNLLW
jgi:hypothetical protein